MPSNFDPTNTPKDILLDTALLYIGATPFGVSRGGLSFDPGRTERNVDFDGKRAPVAGLDRVTGYAPTITGKFLTLSKTEILKFETGAASATTGTAPNDTTTITPIDGSTQIASGSLIVNLRLIWRTGSGRFFQIRFPLAKCTRYTIGSTDNSEAEIDATFAARVDPAAVGFSTDDAPYVAEYIPTI
jgi:hypothetical protein